MKHSSALHLLVSSTAVLASPGVLHFCNRGFCYTKKEPLDPSNMHVSSHGGRKTGLNFCTDSGGHVRDCELFEILGTSNDEFEAVECGTSACKRMQEVTIDHHSQGSTQMYSTVDGEVLEVLDLDENTEKAHVSWKERPKRGRCYDHAFGYEFDCNLVEILDEGLVLIEDLRAGGVFAAQPKSGFSTREGKNQHAPRTPEVMNGSGLADVREDFRTNVNLNLEGI